MRVLDQNGDQAMVDLSRDLARAIGFKVPK